MSYRKIFILALLILLGLTGLLVAVRAQEDEAVVRTDLPPDALPYGGRGPHPVGISDLLIEAEPALPMTMWYPALPHNDLEEAATYRYGIKMDEPLGTVALATFAGQAIRDAPYDLSTGPYPLIILSPGFSIGATAYAWLAEHLASYGFVVLAPEHREHLDPENELWPATITRPQAILTLFASIDEQVGPGGTLEGLIDPELAAVIGHSYGGYTALAAAGARIDTDSFAAHCEAVYETDDPGSWLCDMLLPRLADMATLAGLDSVPEGLWPAWADPRVDAVVPLAGDAFFFGQAGLAEITVPVLAIGGTLDSDSPYLWGTQPTYEYVFSPRKVKIALNEAEHMIFTGPCEEVPWLLKFFADEFCADPGWDRQYAHNLINHFTTAFLLAELKQDTEAVVALEPDAVELPGVAYQAEGY